MGELFGTDGVRGIANRELTPQLAFKLGKAGAYVLTKEKTPKILIARDTRLSGYMLESAIAAGICSVGGTVILGGVLPTPAVAYLVKSRGYDAGVVISASHNKFMDNGIKFFSGNGYKISDEIEEQIEDYIFNKMEDIPACADDRVGTGIVDESCLDEYVDFLCSVMNDKNQMDLSGIRIAVDCANGATSKAAPMVFDRLGASTTALSNRPDGLNINDKCGSTNTKNLIEYVKANKGYIGVALDGDGDRCHMADEEGNLIDGDKIIAINAIYMKEKGILEKDTIVATVMSNLGLFMLAENKGFTVEKTGVGDRYVLERMLDGGFTLGGEASGHIIFLEHSTTGDGILAALHVMNIMKQTGKTLAELSSVMKEMPQVLINASVAADKKNTYLENKTVQKAVDALTSKFSGKGRVLIRPSGTENLVRVMIEGENYDEIYSSATELANLIEEELK